MICVGELALTNQLNSPAQLGVVDVDVALGGGQVLVSSKGLN